MRTTFGNKAIESMVVTVPQQELRFDEEFKNYQLTEEKARRFKKMMGVDRHRIAPPDVTSVDLCVAAFRRLLDSGALGRDEIGAIVFVSLTPDYFVPPSSNVIHGRMGLDREVLCMDVPQGCSGFLLGLIQSFMLLDLPGMRKVVLLCGDTASKQLSPLNRVSWPLVGDAGSATVVSRTEGVAPAFMNIRTDGSRFDSIIVPAGAYRQPSTQETLQVVPVEEGVHRSLEHIAMSGAGVFNFTLEDVPPLIEEILAFSGETIDSIDRFLFHQPNQFILQQMADKLRIPREKLPSNIVGIYGNSASVSIPTNIAHNLGSSLLEKRIRTCIAGFGVGLVWSSMVMDLGPLRMCEIVDYPSSVS